MTAHDDDLRAGFDALRRVDATSVPAFDAVMDRPVVHRRRGILISAGVLTAAAAAVVFLVVRPPSLTEPPPLEVIVASDAPSLLSWQSPTASLMEAAGTDVVTAPPTVTASLLRGTIIDVRTILPTGR